MSFIENQCYKKKITFVSNANDENTVTIALSLSCNHDINKTMISSIEQHISSLFLNDYISDATHKENKKLKKNQTKEEKQLAIYLKKIKA